eukprot:m.131854 g.131854  ORF g.131854 m.131854 type:complete len:87 (+) comp15915_c0_seq4:218-478(+)
MLYMASLLDSCTKLLAAPCLIAGVYSQLLCVLDPLTYQLNAMPCYRFIYLFGTHYKINRIHVANFIIVFFTFLSTASIVVNVIDLF